MTSFIEQQQELAEWISYRHTETPEDKIYLKKELDSLIAQIITNTGAELMRLLDGEETETYQETDGGWCGEETVSLDTIKQHITNVTGVEDNQK